jgi:hypothetical protein
MARLMSPMPRLMPDRDTPRSWLQLLRRREMSRLRSGQVYNDTNRFRGFTEFA